MLNIAVLVSGSGSNLQAIIDEMKKGEINGKIVTVVSNKPDVYALKRAEDNNIPSKVIVSKGNVNFDKELYGKQIKVEFVKKTRPEMKFGSVEELSEQIKNDCIAAKAYHREKGML